MIAQGTAVPLGGWNHHRGMLWPSNTGLGIDYTDYNRQTQEMAGGWVEIQGDVRATPTGHLGGRETPTHHRGDVVRRRRRRGANASGAGGDCCVCLSACVCEYIELATDPFRIPEDVAIPMPPAMPSASLSSYIRGTMATGSGSAGFVAIHAKNLVAGNVSSAWKSNGSYAGNTVAVTGTGVAADTSNSPYDAAAFGNDPTTGDMQYRLVAAGLRIRYTGTELERGGRCSGLAEPDHRSLTGATLAIMRGYDQASSVPVDGKWHKVLWTPARETDYHYSSTAPNSGNSPTMAFMVIAPSATSLPFEYEAFGHFELIGAQARGKKFRSVDPVGGMAAWDALQTVAAKTRGAATATSVMEETAANVLHSTSNVFSMIGMAKKAYDTARAVVNYRTGGALLRIRDEN